ncbi:hypothetical protein GYMLUDRAFT_93695 [Collybiopsis luxurians FD-317 M1]|nr:hypothetical protein GYMLUDRAFT_93695 [Collybiopsis luxurians FD-317 M1]
MTEHELIIDRIITICVSVLLYGINLMLFFTAIYLLVRKKKAQAQRNFHIVTLTALFLFATVAIIAYIVGSCIAIIAEVEDSLDLTTDLENDKGNGLSSDILQETVFSMYSLANAVADIILLSRLYSVWGYRKHVMVVPVILAILNNILGILSAALRLRVTVLFDGPSATSGFDKFWVSITTTTTTFTIVNLFVYSFVNMLVTCLIAGRIWWISWKMTASYGRKGSRQKYRRAVIIFLESGLLYPVSILVVLVVAVLTDADLSVILAQAVGIAPALIIVRVAMGIDFINEQTAVHGLGIASSGIQTAEGGINSRGRRSTVRFAPEVISGQFTSAGDLSMICTGDETSTSEDNHAMQTYHTAQSRMSSAPAFAVTLSHLTLPGQVHMSSG